VIYIQDHIDKEESLSLNDDSNQSESSFISEDDIILFPCEPQYEVSKEEIGRWVDQLMELPEPENSHRERLEKFTEPIIHVAERILSDETF
jgi:hypothetical protein